MRSFNALTADNSCHTSDSAQIPGTRSAWSRGPTGHTAFYDSYLRTYLQRDVRQLINVVSLRDFERFLRACAFRSGQILDKSSLGRDVGISSKAVNDWLSVLTASNQITLLEPWFGNFGKRLVKSPKLYLNDTGLLAHLLGITEPTLIQSPFIGTVWETFIFSELRKLLNKSPDPLSLWFYRDSEQREIDFLLIGGGKNIAIECKWTEIPNLRDAKSIQELMNFLEKKPHPQLSDLRGIVLCRPTGTHPLGPKIAAIPLHQLRPRLGL